MADPTGSYNIGNENNVLDPSGVPVKTTPAPKTSAAPDTGPETTTSAGWVWQKVPVYTNGLIPGTKKLIGYEWKPIGKDTTSGSGSGAQSRNDALTAAQNIFTDYLTAQSQADARKLDAFDQFQKLAQFALPEGATTAPGYEAGGPANAFAAAIGLKNYNPPPIQNTHVDPAALAQPAALPPEVQQMLGNIAAAGAIPPTRI